MKPDQDARAVKSFDDYGEGAPYWMGTATTLVHDAEPDDVIARLHAVVEEITGKPVERVKPRMRFFA